ncbi:hypothetical protein GCM10007425_11310 [Lysinibacillus alkalisoli]|uniref:Uncharacterized protein n=1 Tax=Lysinibacillus alkalisoli TaxID=1911548 RepID=A0A917LFR6_9BACI|nr:thymidylate synthase [Lysinibacillus alkalisoli]GGG18560.1 hypothetical protein GCM10007425_11310 [Lysinibacillus alkalisoli]
MNVAFVHNQTGEEILITHTDDIAGLLAAAQGSAITFPVGRFKYDYHTLDYYAEEGIMMHELVIYVEAI